MDFTQPFKLHVNACGSGLGAVLYQTHEDGIDAVIAYTSRSLTKAKSHYPTHRLEFLTLKWAVVKKFHKYLYGSTFDVYTDSNTLKYILTMAKLDAVSHQWVASLANYNFWLYYRGGKASIDADAILRVYWLGCIPYNSGIHLQVIAVGVLAMQDDAPEGPASPAEAYSCNLHILDPVQDGQQATCMTIEEWHQVLQTDSSLSLVIIRLWHRILGQ